MKLRLLPLLVCLGLAALTLAPATVFAAAAPADTAHFQIPATDDGLPGAGPIRRYDWFRQLWVDRRSGWAKQVKRDQGALVFLGDSITQMWGDVASYFPGIKVANRGISGDTTRGVLIRLPEDVISLNPRGVVLLIGTNDLEEWASPETIAGNLKLIVATLREYDPKMPVILCAVMPSSLTMRRPQVQIQKVNDLYREVTKDQPQVTWLDTWKLFADVHGDAKADEFPDLLHPNGIGYAKWAAALRPLLETLDLAPAWPDDFTPEAGFTSLFDGHDLTGWHYEGGPALGGATATPDGRYVARNDRLVVTVSRQGDGIRKLYTTREFPHDFVLKLEFRAVPNADSGIYLRGPQLQCRDYALAGPWTTLKHYHPMGWNEIVVTVKGGLAHATCNGEVIADAIPIPATGPVGLESDRGQMEYRRIRIKELP